MVPLPRYTRLLPNRRRAGGGNVDPEHRVLGDQRMYEARSRFRTRIEEPVAEDVKLLEQHQPELLEELRDMICEDS